jgi:hypothetical protein
VLVHPNCVALLSAIIQQAFFAGGLGQEVDRAGFDGSPHCPGPLPIFPQLF